MARLLRVALAVLAWAFSRRRVAGALMGAGVASAVAGSHLVWGTGVSLLVAAGLLIPLSIIVGWE